MNEFSFSEFVGELTFEVIFFRLFLATIFGGIIGFEREMRNRPAGFRTHILVCVGAAVVSMIQDQLRLEVIDFSKENGALADALKSDLGRLGAQVISGIGFLAAGIWATGCVGLGIGWGFYNIALVTIVFMLVVMVLLKKVEDSMLKKSDMVNFELEFYSAENISEQIEKSYEVFKKKSVVITEVEKNLDNNTLIFNALVTDCRKIPEIIVALSVNENIKSIRDYKREED